MSARAMEISWEPQTEEEPTVRVSLPGQDSVKTEDWGVGPAEGPGDAATPEEAGPRRHLLLEPSPWPHGGLNE